MEKLAGYVEHIIYRNADNGYTVLNLVSGEEEITCVGIFSAIAEGENIEASGDYTDHPTYGKQFKVESFEEKAPEDEEAIERYLGSGAIRGIGLALAADSKKPEESVPFLSEALMSCVASLVNTVIGYVNVYYSQQNYAGMQEITQWGIGTLSGLKDGDTPCFLDKVNGMLLVCLAYAQLQEDKNNTPAVREAIGTGLRCGAEQPCKRAALCTGSCSDWRL